MTAELTHEFDDAIALQPLEEDGDAAGAGRFAAAFDDRWRIGNAVNGGLVMAMAAAALQRRLVQDGGHSDPIALSGYFLTPSAAGDVTVTTDLLRTGRTLSTGSVSVSQPGPDGEPVERMRALASFGDLDGWSDVIRAATPPDMPPPEQCLSADQAPPDFLAASSLLERIDLRIDPGTAGWAVGRPSKQGQMRGWLRFRDGREPDPISLLFALDALPPVAFDLGLLGWTPTLEFTGHIRANPAPGWLQVVLSSENLTRGLMEEDAQIWDSTGRFVAQSRQLCGVRVPADHPAETAPETPAG